ncbi:MAG: hypothetical protein AB1627_03935 [Chloroflexota bacterium]
MAPDDRDPRAEPEPDPTRITGPRPLGGLADLAELLGGDTPRSRRFLGGLVVGALVGAALAGGSLLRGRGRSGGPR